MYYYKKGNTYTASPVKITGADAISQAEYESIKSIMDQKPVPPEGCGYRLTTDLTWELYELPPVIELTAEEALSIITGGAV